MAETRIAIYIRLSLADEDTGKTKAESNSIVNQRSLIHHYLDGHPELAGYPRTEFVDDGFSGTRTDRPAFQRMMKELREGVFSICVSKDFSRIFRDYIEMGDCLECVFPTLKIRYISINDGYDSRNYKGTTGGLDVVMRNIVYAAYSKDLSIKEKTGKLQSARKGRRATGQPRYGYQCDPEHKGMDIIDPEAAKVVRRIFDAAIGGMKVLSIAKMLNDEGVPCPGEYHRMKYPESGKFVKERGRMQWTAGSVIGILDRYAYTGAAVNGLRKPLTPGGKKTTARRRDEWIVVKGMHEAIVTEEEYELAQKAIHKGTMPERKSGMYPLRQIMACGECGRLLSRVNEKRRRFICYNKGLKTESPCNKIKTPLETELEQVAFNAIRSYISLADKRKKENRKKNLRNRKTAESVAASTALCEKKIKTLKQERLSLYEQYCEGELEIKKYSEQKGALEDAIRDQEAEIERMRIEKNAQSWSESEIASEAEAACEAYKNETHLTYEMAHAFIDRIFVYADGHMEIRWRFKDFFADNKGMDYNVE